MQLTSVVVVAPSSSASPLSKYAILDDGGGFALSPALQQQQQPIKLPMCPELPQAEIEPVEAFVSNAVASKHAETSSSPSQIHEKGYDAIVDALRRPEDPLMLKRVLIALRTARNGKTLQQLATSTKVHAKLLHFVFRFNPIDVPTFKKEPTEAMLSVFRDFSLADAHFHLLLALVTANSTSAASALRLAWKLIANRLSAPQELIVRLHSLFACVVRAVPKVRADVMPILASTCPFWSKPQEHITWFYQQCFLLLQYNPFLDRLIFEFVVEKALEMDVNVKIKEGGEVTVETDSHGAQKDAPQDDSQPDPAIAADELSEKLDCILSIILEFVTSRGKADLANARHVYGHLVPVFESSVLTTHKSKFVQFCIFLACGSAASEAAAEANHLSPTADFVSRLQDIIADPYRATHLRQSASCYLASFVSRATFVPVATVCQSVSALLRWAEGYVASMQQGTLSIDRTRGQADVHSLFYTVCQAAFYVMCYRAREVMQYYRNSMEKNNSSRKGDTPDGILPEHIDMSSERWTRICSHPLQPLRYCLESVRVEFLHVARVFDLIDTGSFDRLVKEAQKMKAKKKKKSRSISTKATMLKRTEENFAGGLGLGENPLDSFFPFDPILLRRSSVFVEPYYNTWQGPIEDNEFEEYGESDLDSSGDESEHSLDMDDGNTSADGLTNSPSEMVPLRHLSGVQSAGNISDPTGRPADFSIEFPEQAGEETLKAPWTEQKKRPRSLSILSNGSW